PLTPEQGRGAGLRVDTRTAEVWLNGQLIPLTTKEYLAIAALHEQHGGVVSKEMLAERVWPELGGVVSDETIAQLVSRLRHKLEADPEHARYLRTVRGLGYRLVTA